MTTAISVFIVNNKKRFLCLEILEATINQCKQIKVLKTNLKLYLCEGLVGRGRRDWKERRGGGEKEGGS